MPLLILLLLLPLLCLLELLLQSPLLVQLLLPLLLIRVNQELEGVVHCFLQLCELVVESLPLGLRVLDLFCLDLFGYLLDSLLCLVEGEMDLTEGRGGDDSWGWGGLGFDDLLFELFGL